MRGGGSGLPTGNSASVKSLEFWSCLSEAAEGTRREDRERATGRNALRPSFFLRRYSVLRPAVWGGKMGLSAHAQAIYAVSALESLKNGAGGEDRILINC